MGYKGIDIGQKIIEVCKQELEKLDELIKDRF
jgi:hypothetical protein